MTIRQKHFGRAQRRKISGLDRIEFNRVVQIFVPYIENRIEEKSVFFRLEGYSALASGRMGGQEGQDENIP